MAEQKAKARAAWSGSGEQATPKRSGSTWTKVGSTEFLGYDTETAEGVILALVRDGARGGTPRRAGDAVDVVVNQTPFYAESGGQVGDQGTMKARPARGQRSPTRGEGRFVRTWPR
jgi:alanyl-tRNA synthetase